MQRKKGDKMIVVNDTTQVRDMVSSDFCELLKSDAYRDSIDSIVYNCADGTRISVYDGTTACELLEFARLIKHASQEHACVVKRTSVFARTTPIDELLIVVGD